MTGIDVSGEVRGYLRDEIDAQCLGEEFWWDVTMMAAVTPQGTVVQYTIMIATRSPLLGTGPLLHVAALPFPRPTPEMVRTVVEAGLKGLRELSAKTLSSRNGEPRQPAG